MQLRYIEFDSTGEVLILKKYHPLKNKNHSFKKNSIEFPKYLIMKHEVQNKNMVIWIKGGFRQRIIKLHFSMFQMTNANIRKVKIELEKCTNK